MQTKKPKPLPVPNDLDRLKAVSRKMLALLEEALDSAPFYADDTLGQKLHERLFGGKTSLAATLVTLAELLLKLEQAGKVPFGAGYVADDTAIAALSQADVALVEAFVRKMQPALMESNS